MTIHSSKGGFQHFAANVIHGSSATSVHRDEPFLEPQRTSCLDANAHAHADATLRARLTTKPFLLLGLLASVAAGSSNVFAAEPVLFEARELLILRPSDGGTGAGDLFHGPSLSGDTMAVTALEDNVNGTDAGAVYIFERNLGGENNWGEAKKIYASDAAADGWFGWGASVKGDTLVVGSNPGALGCDCVSGATYIFGRNHGGENNWGEAKKLTSDDPSSDDSFGSGASVEGDLIVVNAPTDDGAQSDAGAVYLFARNAGGSSLFHRS